MKLTNKTGKYMNNVRTGNNKKEEKKGKLVFIIRYFIFREFTVRVILLITISLQIKCESFVLKSLGGNILHRNNGRRFHMK